MSKRSGPVKAIAILTVLCINASGVKTNAQDGQFLTANASALRTLARLLTSPRPDDLSLLPQNHKRDIFATVVQLRGTVKYSEGDLVFTLGCGFKPNLAENGFIPNPNFNYPYFGFKSKEGGFAQLWLEKVKDGQDYKQIAILGAADKDIGVAIISSNGKGGTLILECPDTTLAQTTSYELGKRGCVRSDEPPNETSGFSFPNIELMQRVHGDNSCSKLVDYKGIKEVSLNIAKIKMQEQDEKSSAFWSRAIESLRK